MDRLASCYFCGAALDDPVDEYPVVPKSLHPDPDQQRSVVLCDGCREKLATIVESVVDVATAAAPTDGPDADPAGSSSPAADAPLDTDASGPATDALDAGDDSRADAAVEGGSTVDDADVEATTGRRDEPTSQTSTDPTPDEEGGTNRDEPTADASAAADSGAGADRPDETEESDGDGPSMTALEYNKVIRLLQNRELPVDRSEFRAVATSAYDISESEFEAVLDAAVSRGLIAESDGQIVSAE